MHPACQLCRGACCESLVLHLPPTDAGTWLGFHGQPIGDRHVEFATPCSKLSTCGKCSIHRTRPEHCRTYAVGGPDCRATVARRRPKQAAAILAALAPST